MSDYMDDKPCDCDPAWVCGVEIRGVYDGVLFWQCRQCDALWHRFAESSMYWPRAEKYISQFRAKTEKVAGVGFEPTTSGL